MFRSQAEYLAILDRGRPSDLRATFKTNRVGYQLPKMRFTNTFQPPAPALDRYRAAYAEFLEKVGVSDMVAQAQNGVLDRARRVLDTYNGMSPEEREQWPQTFRQLDFKALQKTLSKQPQA
ncbi:hypothetical protein AIOL_002838 [Candidatus Rhodobacter oscarellae]|uniref:Uncharacterized protein n=1 Tax=Candidatus Rhodobacter oscarellae TaxID=1675527 RepID=A0A0J9E4Y9_9RHOB|nr:hypothetical protein [Candidatus Rhodobacter lobularis]KMW57870.1 hypothetical protein AIOL_002838 [Candidatus Rhodobacter lobularis]